MNHYEQKLEDRRDRLQARAERLQAIPMGQPILVGHYSEKGDRAYRARAGNAISRGIKLERKADELERRAASVGSGGISSDDPEAVTKLQKQLDFAREMQATFKQINALVRKNDIEGLKKLAEERHHTKEWAERLMFPDFMGRRGIPSFTLTNNSANIRRIEQRIKQLEARDSAPTFEPITGNGWTCALLRDDNRIAFYFDAIPNYEVRQLMKRAAFKWSPSRSAWVRQDTPNARYSTKMLIKSLNA
jgi:hypothetical protein